MLIGIAGAVQPEVVVGGTQAVDGDAGIILLASDGAGRGEQGAGGEHHELQRVAAVQRQILHAAGLDGGLNFRRGALHHGSIGSDLRGLGSLADLEGKTEVDGVAGKEFNRAAGQRLEPWRGGGYLVRSDRDFRELKDAVLIGNGCQLYLGLGIDGNTFAAGTTASVGSVTTPVRRPVAWAKSKLTPKNTPVVKPLSERFIWRLYQTRKRRVNMVHFAQSVRPFRTRVILFSGCSAGSIVRSVYSSASPILY